jgi:hypothetical protein
MPSKTARKPAIKRTGATAPPLVAKRLPIASKTLTPIVKVAATKPIKEAVKEKPTPNPIQAKASAKTKPADKTAALKVKKTKLVRDSFTIPKDEYAALQKLKDRAIALTKPTKKSELLRAGLLALASMPDAAFLATLAAIPALKTGRPKGVKASKK